MEHFSSIKVIRIIFGSFVMKQKKNVTLDNYVILFIKKKKKSIQTYLYIKSLYNNVHIVYYIL